MDWAHFFAFNLALLAALISPGPAMLVCIRASLRGGFREGALTGLGLATAAACWTLAALFGLDAVFTLFPWAYGALKIAGAAYLIYIAWTTWRHAADPLGDVSVPAGRAIRTGLLVNLSNPKSMLFAGAVLVVIFPADMSTLARFAVALNHVAIEIVAYGVLAYAIAATGIAKPLLAAKKALERVTAVILGGLGLRLVLERSP
ncbi:MAG: LysE family translocator [Pseudomonadota bacterium]